MDLLKTIKQGRETRPRRVLLYGAHGIGKSTCPSTKPIYLQTEDGLADIGVDRTPLLKSTVEVSQWLIDIIPRRGSTTSSISRKD
jgi:hypothetical protein